MTSESVRVAVRVRPFNSREIERGAKSIIEMEGRSTKIVHPSDPKNVKTFNFDYSYWSHNGFKVDPDGQLDKDSPTSRYASQRCVFEDLGQDVLKNALEGYNCSLFAYGQTGSGKSYSMVGYETNKGIVPITCNELFKIIESNTTSSTKYAVSLSMLEIYNERVKDLLVKSNKNLEIRQSEKLGFYVQDLEKINVGSYKEIERKMNQGSANRTIAATQMNATSSRAHTVITIEFKQIISSDSGVNTKSSTINLIDLAGSERADSTGATGDRLKEGANINKSLSALGNVIAALADLSGGKKNVLVPYRDSVLTKMLKNALGGNSKTIMIAALSPADINYDETLSTLRYADRAKRIKNVAMVNENPLEKLIRELRDENERLKRMLNGELPNEIDIRNLTETEIQKIRQELEAELRADMRINSEMLELHDKSSWNGKVIESETSNLSEGVLSKKKSMECPYFCNLNEDPQLSGVLLHFIENEVMYIGKCEEDEEYSINISGPGVQPRHAITTFDPEEKVVTINFCSKDSVVRVNGVKISGITTINDLDRILLGSNNLYVFHNPFLPSESSISIDWEFAQLEIASADGYTSGERSALESQIIEILPMVNEINAISKELNSHRVFNVLIIPQVAQDVLYGEEAKPKVMVKMTSTINNNCWLWERSVFINRRYMIQDQYQAFLNGEDRELISENSDPFWEPPTDLLVGQAYVYLQNISHNLGMSHEVRLIDYKGHEEGILYVKIEPCNQVGEVVDEDDTDSILDDPSDLLNKSLFIKVTINKLFLYKARFFHGSNVKFRFYREDKMYTTETVKDTLEPQFDFEVIIELSSVTRDHLQYFEDGWITFLVFGTQKDVSAIESKQNILYKVKEASVKAEVNRRHDETEFRVYKTIDRLQRKKIGEVKKACIEWASKPPEEQQFDPFYRAIASVVFNDGKKFKVVASMIGKTKVAMNKLAKNKTKNGETKADSRKTNVTFSRKVGGKDFSEICSIM